MKLEYKELFVAYFNIAENCTDKTKLTNTKLLLRFF